MRALCSAFLSSALVLLAGCGSGSGDVVPHKTSADAPSENERTDAPPAGAQQAKVAGSGAPAPLEPSPPEPSPEATTAEPPTARPVPLDEPPALHLAFDGPCSLQLLSHGSDVYFVHDRTIERIEGGLTPAETWTLDAAALDVGGREAAFSSIEALLVHEPGTLYVVASFLGGPSAVFTIDARGTTRVEPSSLPLRGRHDVRALWRWPEGSVLALADAGSAPVEHQGRPVLGVLAGAALVLDSGPVWAGDPCADSPFPRSWDVHVVEGGPVTVLQGCADGWVSVHAPGDTTGTHERLHAGTGGGILALDDRGEGYILAQSNHAYRSPSKEALFAWKGGKATPVALPRQGDTGWLVLDPDGNPWLSTEGEVFRREGERWVHEPLPESPSDGVPGGIDRGLPWVFRDAVTMRGPDGRWHAVRRPDATHEEAMMVGIDRIEVRAPDDVWLLGVYPHEVHGRIVGRQVLYTTRPVDEVHTCS